MLVLLVQVVLLEYAKEVTHHRAADSWEGLPCYGHRLACVLSAVVEDEPEEDVVGLTATSTTLLNYYLLV